MKVVVVGGVAGGATFASQLRMLNADAEIIVLEKDATMSFANCGLPYFIGGFVKKEEHLIAATPSSFKEKKQIDVRTLHEVKKINRTGREITIFDHQKQVIYTETYDILVLSPGARPLVPSIDGLDYAQCFSLRTIEHMRRIDHYIDQEKPDSVCLVGGGFIGLEMAENFRARGLDVHLIQRSSHVLSMLDEDLASIVHEELEANGVRVHTNTEIQQIEPDGKTLHLTSGQTIQCDFLLLAIGVTPSVGLAENAGLTIGETGAIEVNEWMQTNDPAIYAIGDAVQTTDLVTGDKRHVPLAWIAHRQAYVVARHLTGDPVPFDGVLGTAICKVFDLTVAITGHGSQSLKKKELAFERITHRSNQHAGYYPGAEKMTMNLYFAPESGKILGGQMIGKDGVDKRMDVLSTAMIAGMSVTDLQKLEIAYSPPYSGPKDALNMVGYKAYPIVKKAQKE